MDKCTRKNTLDKPFLKLSVMFQNLKLILHILNTWSFAPQNGGWLQKQSKWQLKLV